MPKKTNRKKHRLEPRTGYGSRGGKKMQLSVSMDSRLIDHIDQLADENDLSRSMMLNHIVASHCDTMNTVQELHENENASETILAVLNIPAVKSAIQTAMMKLADERKR